MDLREPPISVEAEACLLGSFIICGDLGEKAARAIRARVLAMVNESSFAAEAHQTVFKTLSTLHATGKPIDALIVREALIQSGSWEDVGVEALSQILSVPSSAHAEHYAGIVREKAMRRELLRIAEETIRAVYGTAEAPQLCLDLAGKASRLARTGTRDEVQILSDLATSVYERNMEGSPLRIPTGLRDLDRLIGGLRKGGKTIIGAKPGMGKSVLVKQIGLNLARQGVKFGVVSVEESGEKIAENALSNLSGVINNRIAFNHLDTHEWKKLAAGVSATQGLPFYVVDSARRLSKLIAAIHTLVCEHGCEVVAVDHLHIIESELTGRETRERQIAYVSAELKWVWKELGVCGIEAAQLNRASGKERPSLDSLRDSGSLEQDGDTIILLHREDYYRKPGEHMDGVLELLVAKNKDGAPGTVPVKFDPARQIISDHNGTDPFIEQVRRAPRQSMQEVEL